MKATLSAVARGDTLAALKKGARVVSQDGSTLHNFSFDHVSEIPAEVSEKGLDAVVVAVKSTVSCICSYIS